MNNEENKETNSENFEDLEFVESTEDGEALPEKDVVKKLREELKTCRKEKEEYLTGWQRAKADYINLQKELELARVNGSVFAKEKMAEKLLPALDSFEMAFGNIEHWEKLDKEWQDGIKLIYSQLISGLASSGVEKIDEANVPFDPNIHQSISVVETEDEPKDHTVEKVLHTGYKIGERVIRPAKVTIYEYKE
ncbi:MAG: nucleotide exchange factor GrpE [Candidatus Paceibacterota bacterium]|jgi:molecular chaperone GrpE